MHKASLAALAAASVFAVSGASHAELIERTSFVNATGACNGALPSFEGALRKRPTAIANEGTASSFVSCSLAGDETNYGTAGVVAVVINRGTAAVNVSCTYVDGVAQEISEQPPVYSPKTVSAPVGVATPMVWLAEDAPFSSYVNLNCSLPPKVEIAAVGYGYAEGNQPDEPGGAAD